MILRDAYGWPVELVQGRPILNIFRRLLVTDCIVTWQRRHEGWPKSEPDPTVCGGYAPPQANPEAAK
jgi:hypothetical protein